MTGAPGTDNYGCGVCYDCADTFTEDLNTRVMDRYGETAVAAAQGQPPQPSCTRDLTVFSYDGQYDLRNMTEIKMRNFPDAVPRWKYDIAAFSDHVGVAKFAQSGGWEGATLGNKVESVAAPDSASNTVRQFTVDVRAQLHDAVDIIKVDTEGHDHIVISGALVTAATKAAVIVFETGHEAKNGGPSLATTVNSLAEIGFACYLTGHSRETAHPLQLTGCMVGPNDVFHRFGLANVYCAHTARARNLANAFHIMSHAVQSE